MNTLDKWIQEKSEYDALTERQRGAYDYVGQQGGTHEECMDATRWI